MTTVLKLIQDFTDKMNLPTPSGVVGSAEKGNRQYLSLMRELVADLSEHRWQQQTLRLTWTSVASESQGSLPSIFGAGYAGLVKDSLWNETASMRIYGPVSAQTWNTLKSLPAAGPEYQCWVSGDELLVLPVLPAGDTLTAAYITSYGVLDVTNVPKARITSDDDTLLFPDNVVMRGFEAKWRKQKGELGWEDDYNAYIGLVAKNLVREGGTRLSLSSEPVNARPGIIIPPGSWNV